MPYIPINKTQKKHVWFLEDDDLFAYLIEKKFESSIDYKITWFSEKKQLLERFKNSAPPSVLVLDDNLGMTQSDQLILELKSAGYKVPIISLTSNQSIERAVELMTVGIKGYVKKSKTCFDELIKEIDRVVD